MTRQVHTIPMTTYMYCSNGLDVVMYNFEWKKSVRRQIHYSLISCDTIAWITGGHLMTKEHSRNQVRPVAYGVNSGYLSIHNQATRLIHQIQIFEQVDERK